MSTTTDRRSFTLGALAAGAALALPRAARAAAPDVVTLDYAYYNPPSLILKQRGWLEEALKPLGTRVEWVLSLGSNKANGFLAANAVQFGSTAGSAALLARANGAPIRAVYLFSQPEWTAVVVGRDSKVRGVRELRGKKIAATKGTDPYFFLLRALAGAGLKQDDVEIVELQHPDGRQALARGQVDAWAGLDPHMAAAQLDDGARLLYRNIGFCTFGALNVREDFLHDHPDVAATVLKAYNRAHAEAARDASGTAAVLAAASGLERRVAELALSRTRFPDPVPGRAFHTALEGVVPIVRANALALPSADLDGALAALPDPGPARAARRA